MRRFIEEPPRPDGHPSREGNEAAGYSHGYFERLSVMLLIPGLFIIGGVSLGAGIKSSPENNF